MSLVTNWANRVSSEYYKGFLGKNLFDFGSVADGNFNMLFLIQRVLDLRKVDNGMRYHQGKIFSATLGK